MQCKGSSAGLHLCLRSPTTTVEIVDPQKRRTDMIHIYIYTNTMFNPSNSEPTAMARQTHMTSRRIMHATLCIYIYTQRLCACSIVCMRQNKN